MTVAFDQFQRYKHVEEIINLVRNDETYTILEVGANQHKNLEKFLPQDSITYLDIEVPEELINDPQYIQADATNMPEVNNRKFDFVIALDVFEHISETSRENFIKELHRVSKRGVIIAAPFDSVDVVDAEIRANEYYKQLYGNGFRWLEEHRENNLPNLSKTTDFYLNNGIEFIHFQHGSLNVWEKLIQLHFLFAGENEYHAQRFLIDKYYNDNIYKYDYGQKNYRTFFVSCSSPNKLNLIQEWIKERISNTHVATENFKHLDWLENQIKALHLDKKESKVLSSIENMLDIGNSQLEKSISLVEKKLDISNSQLSKSIELMKTMQSDLDKKAQLESINQVLITENQALITETQELKHQLTLKENHIQNVEELNNTITSTKGWRMLEKMRRVKMLVKRNKTAIFPKVYRKIKNEGIKSTVQTIESKIQNELQETRYHEWFMKHQPSELELHELKLEIEKFEKKPLISVVMPTYNTPLDLLNEAVLSLQNQIYTNWELCICDDNSPNREVWTELQKYANEDARIKIVSSIKNLNISGATNLAISIAHGEYIGFLDHDDKLTSNALFEVVKAINENNPDLLYSDEDKLEEDGTLTEPFFKPDWSPDLLRSVNYICHFVVCKKELGNDIGWLRDEYNGAQDHDFLLRLTQICNNIHHIPKILYHWRKVATSTSVNPNSKPHAHSNGLKAVEDFLRNKYGSNVKVDETDYLFVYDPRYILPNDTKISIIIPTKDHVDLLSECVNSILNISSYQNYEILILNNNSIEDKTYSWFMDIQKNKKIKVIDAFFDFNWSKLNNLGIEHASGDVFIFLNNDMKIISHDWMERLAEKAMLDDVGTVGALLLYEDETIQHAGVVLGMGGWADHVFKGMNPIHYGTPFASPMVPRNVLASTGACLAISRKTIDEIGKFDEEFIICGSDVEISLRAYKKGYFNIYDSYVKLYHYESKTRDSFIPEIDFKLSEKHYSPYRENGDPFYNPNLSMSDPRPKLS